MSRRSIFAAMLLFMASVVSHATIAAEPTLIKTGRQPVLVVADEITGRTFVANSGVTDARFAPGTGSVTVVDRTGESHTVAFAGQPIQMAVSESRHQVVVANVLPNNVVVIDTQTLDFTVVPVDARTDGPLAIVEETGKAYVGGKQMTAATYSGTLVEVDLQAMSSRVMTLPSLGIHYLARSDDPLSLYAAGPATYRTPFGPDGHIARIDVRSGEITSRISVGTEIRAFLSGGADLIAIVVDRTTHLLSDAIPSHVLAIDKALVSTRLVATLPRNDPGHLADGTLVYPGQDFLGFASLDRNGDRLFAVSAGKMGIVDLETGTVHAVPITGYALAATYLEDLDKVALISLLADGTEVRAQVVGMDGTPAQSIVLPAFVSKAGGRYAIDHSKSLKKTFFTVAHADSVAVLADVPTAARLITPWRLRASRGGP